MSIDRYRRKQLAKREGGAAPIAPPGPADAPGAGSDSNATAAPAVVPPSTPTAPTRGQR
jgi:hypothetical protein